MKRCFPKNDDAPLLTKYHDHEWGKLNLNEHYLYEMMVLESFQSGLSWQLVLDKRENFRQAFAGFNVERVAKLPVINVSNYWKTEESFVISEKLMPPLIMPV